LFSAARLTSLAHVASLGSGDPGGSVEKWEEGAAVVEVVDGTTEVVVGNGDIVVVVDGFDDVDVVDDARDVVVVDIEGAVVETLKVAAPLFQCSSAPQPVAKMPIFTVCMPGASVRGTAHVVVKVLGRPAENDRPSQ
jgi:hypothetical protein